MKARRTFNQRLRSLHSLANQPRRRPPLKPRTGFGVRGTKKPKPSWWTPECEAKRSVVCRACGFIPPTGGIELHHAVPRSQSRAGRSDPRNIIPLCHDCHRNWHGGTPLPREIFTAQEWAFIETLKGPGWLGRRYPRDLEARAAA